MSSYFEEPEELEGECPVCGCPMEVSNICSTDCLKADML